MRKTFTAVLALAAFCIAAPLAVGQSSGDYRDPGQGSRNDQFYHNRDASQAELAQADARLNRVYQNRIADAQRADRIAVRQRPRGWYSQEAALRSAERAWIAYRDADCRYAAQDATGTRIYGSVVRACLIDRTNDRLAVLQDARTQFSQR
jgi:uncharacterized protein YecT (DUF1311 family)